MRFLVCMLIALAATPALGEDVPFAERTPHASGDANKPHSGSLGAFMELAQSWHIKLWYAGHAKDTELSSYTIDRMVDGFKTSAMLYQNIPIRYLVALNRPFLELRHAVQDRNTTEFVQSYADLTNACNACHRAANVGFIVIKTPIDLPFSDQDFRALHQ